MWVSNVVTKLVAFLEDVVKKLTCYQVIHYFHGTR